MYLPHPSVTSHNTSGRPSLPPNAPRAGTPDRQLVDAAHYASEDDFVQMMNVALQKGANLDVTDERGNNILEIAVQRNSIRMVRALIARGANLPIVPADGVDLMMHAASRDNADIITFLESAEGMLVDCNDRWGKTALHYAVKAHSSRAVEALLDCGADVNASAEHISLTELNEIFGEYHFLYEIGITPLTMAVASHNLLIVNTLLAWGAEISTGVTNPLRIAIKSDDAAMLDLLIAHCQESGKLAEVIDQSLLHDCLITTADTHLLEKVLDCHQQYALGELDLNEALALAIDKGHVDQAAMLIAYGARPGSPSGEAPAPWLSASELRDPAMFNLLVATRGEQFSALLATSDVSPAPILTTLCELVPETIDLAEYGIFREAVAPAIPELLTIAERRTELSATQIATESAHALLSLVTSNEAAPNWPAVTAIKQHPLVSASELQQIFSGSPHRQHHAIHRAIDTQRSQLVAAALPVVKSLPDMLAAVLSADFFASAEKEADTRHSTLDIRDLLSEKMRTVHGLPEPMILLISDCWLQSRNALLAHPDAANEAVALSALMANILFCKLDELLPEPGSLMARCKNTLLGTLSASRTQWQMLVKQPAQFLRSLEGRTGWRPVNMPSLIASLQKATGLPPNVCIALATCWQQAVAETSEVTDSVPPNQRFASLDAAFARHWQGWLEEHAADAGEFELPITPRELLESIDWCEQVQQRAGDTRKRKATSEAEGSPAAKPPRLQ